MKINNYYLKNSLQNILTSIDIGIIEIDKSNTIIEVNKVAEEILNLEKQHILQKKFNNALPLKLVNFIKTAGAKLVNEKSLETKLKINKKFRIITIVKNTRLNNQQDLFCILQNSSSTQKTKIQEEVNKLKSHFISQVSHEMRTPLTTIRGYSELLFLRDYNKETVKKFAQYINIEAERLTHIMSDLLDITKIEQGIFETHKEIFSLPFVIKERIKHYQKKTSLHKLILEVESAEIQVDADKKKIKQVIDNLLDNAMKYSPRGGEINIKIFLAQNNKKIFKYLNNLNLSDNQIVVAISDQGDGIPEHNLTNLFEKFFRAEKHKEKQIKGTGLGLTICKHILNLHKGIIWVESKENQGSTFYFTLPILSSLQQHKKILVVDDEKEITKMLTNLLQELKFDIIEAFDGKAGLTKAEMFLPDLIITDLRMPKLNGYEMIRKIKENPKLKNTKILVITGSEDLNIFRIQELGIDEFIAKPFSINVLINTIKHLLH